MKNKSFLVTRSNFYYNILLIIFLYLLFIFSIYSQKVNTLNEISPNTQIRGYLNTVTMPFQFPAETKLLYNPQSNYNFRLYDYHNPASLALPVFSVPASINNFSMQEKGASATYFHNNIRFSLELLTGYANSYLNILTPVKIQSIFNFSYNISNLFTKKNNAHKINFLLQLSSQQWIENGLFNKKANPYKQDTKLFYINPGISFSTGPFELEGLIKLPMHNNPSQQNSLNIMNELHGRLGLKWYLPDNISP
ncbi:MAG: hypothetical protein KDK90_24490 [Leptospiraceae bacterium]|nr:hypothetical protein [Leptospiraceae bacterium]